MVKIFSKLIIKYRWFIVVLTVVITAFFGYQIKFLQIDSNVIDSLPKTDTVVNLFKEVGKQFGGNEIGMIILKDNNVLTPNVLKTVKTITDTVAQTDGILSVTSLTNVMNLKVEGDNFQVGQLINSTNWPKSEKEADSLRDEILKNKMIVGNIISKDGKATLIIFTFTHEVNAQAVSENIIRKIKKINPSVPYYFAGSTFLTQYIADVINHDVVTLIPISFLLIIIILFFSFHSVRGVVLPILTAGFAIIWGMGTFAVLGLKLSMVSNNVPIIILAVGTAYAIHVLNQVSRQKESNHKNSIIEALNIIAIPVVLTALTTMIGFLSFIFGAYLTMIRDFGILAALGTFYSAFLALVFVPALLALFPSRKTNVNNNKKERKHILSLYILLPIKKAVLNHSKLILWLWIGLLLVSITGIFMIKRSVSVNGYFKANHPVSIGSKIMDENFGGMKPVFVVFKGNMQSPEVLKGMLNLEKYMKESPYVTSTKSIADIVAQLNKAMGGTNTIPDDAAKIGQLWFLLDQQENIKQLVTEDLDQGIIMAKFKDSGENASQKFTNFLQPYLKANASKNYSITITGMPFVNARLDKSLVNSQLASLTIAIFFVIAIVSLIFNSFFKGLYASIPILTTIAILYGAMGIFGIPLNVVTVLVASIAMGIGIDYSIHFLSHYNHTLKKYSNVKLAIEETILVSGKAIFINFISVTAGFLVLAFSQLIPMVYFGILIAFSMFGSMLGALTLLPITMLMQNNNENKNDKK
ncbi:MAG: hypothetical protein DRJ09_09170 [Bacteroidetes bacterium]|nr:MAG: hypothetical protein DRJ09_09170 [Bacteroidota bacterium]